MLRRLNAQPEEKTEGGGGGGGGGGGEASWGTGLQEA